MHTNAVVTAHPFLLACRRQPTPYTPIWLMRQAGRYMAEYRAVRERFGFLELCHHPEAAAEVTVTAVERLGVDAAIIFADILLILEPLDVGLAFAAGDGPTLSRPVLEPDDVRRLRDYDTDDALAYVYAAVRAARAGLGGRVPLIGFAGAPFTLASYLIEGGGSRQYLRTKRFMYEHGGAWHDLLGMLARLVNRYLRAQIAAGAEAVQLFDSWVGCLSPDDYRTYVLPHSRTALHGLSALAPVIHFGTDTAGLLGAMREAGGDVIGVDWRIDLDVAWNAIGGDRAIQGNLDPVTLLARLINRYLRAQIAAGAEAVQLFDSWVGCLSPDDYRAHVLPHARAALDGLSALAPVIHFGTDTGGLLELQRDAGGDVIGVDWRIDLDAAWNRIGHDRAVQGNLDPLTLFAPIAEIRRQAQSILARAAGRPGHIFNLGHGILPQTPVDHVRALVDAVHELSHR